MIFGMKETFIDSILSIPIIGRIVNSPIGRRLLFGAFWSGFGTIISRGLAVVASFCVARFCGKEAFGEYGMVINTAAMLSTVCGMGMGHTVIKYVAELRERNPGRASGILALTTCITWTTGIVIGGLFMLLADWIALRMLAAPHLAEMLRIATAGVVLGIFNEVQMASLTGCEAYRDRAKITVLTGLLQSVLLIVASYLWGIKGAVIGYSIAHAGMVVLTTWFMRPVWRKFNLRRDFSVMTKEWRVLFSFGLPTILLLFLGMPVSWFTRTLLAKVADGYNQLAIINAASPWSGLIAFLVSTACTALVPIISDLVGKGERRSALRVVWKAFRYNACVVLPICIVLTALAPLILRFYGADFVSGVMIFSVMMWTSGLGTIYQPMWNYLVGAGMMWTNFIIVFATAVLQIAFAWYMVRWGGLGLALAALIITVLRLFVLCVLFSYLNKSLRSART